MELKVPEASASDLAELDRTLPPNVSGLSFAQPNFVEESKGKVRVHSVSSPRHVAQHLGVLGDRLMNASQAVAALSFYDLALRVGHQPALHVKRAEALFHLGRVEEAQRELSAALEQDPRNAEAWFWKGRVALHQERHGEALNCFTQASEARHDSAEWKQINATYQRFAQIYHERDQLHLRNLKPKDYVVEIEQLQLKVQGLRQEIQSLGLATLLGMEMHLDALENLFKNWLRELLSASRFKS